MTKMVDLYIESQKTKKEIKLVKETVSASIDEINRKLDMIINLLQTNNRIEIKSEEQKKSISQSMYIPTPDISGKIEGSQIQKRSRRSDISKSVEHLTTISTEQK